MSEREVRGLPKGEGWWTRGSSAEAKAMFGDRGREVPMGFAMIARAVSQIQGALAGSLVSLLIPLSRRRQMGSSRAARESLSR